VKRKKTTIQQKRKSYLLNEETPFAVTEAFRNLKASISVSVPKNKEGGVSIVVTSSFPEEGKTTVSSNLALMFAQSDMKVVLVDADIRKGRVAKYFKTENSVGLSDLISGQATLEEVLQQSKINENLYIIPCGTSSPKPYELLESEPMRALNETLKKQFDYVFYDTPPILVVPDVIALAPKTEGTILVTRYMASYVSDIQKSLNSLRFAKANILGTIVNDYHAKENKKRDQYSYSYGN
jgi:capsular exopolysaccharide synthesis family protein